MIKYNVRSRQLVDIINDLKDKKLILSPYFQRKLVWRDIHKIDFIKTILFEFPFPEIFIAKGDLDIEEMTSTSCIVDGQQRLNAILEFIDGKFKVDDKGYTDLSSLEKEKFLKYEIAIIDLDIKHDDPQIKEMFKRLNRTFYSLSNIEKISSEYAASEFMLVAKFLCEEISELDNYDDDINLSSFTLNPNITKEFLDWAGSIKADSFTNLILKSEVFTKQEVSRQVHLNQVINIIATIEKGFFNRNADKEILDEFSSCYPNKNIVVEKVNSAAKIINNLKLKKNSYWLNKANIFSLIVAFCNNLDYVKTIDIKNLKQRLTDFENTIPDDYKLAAKEGVNNKKERLLRNKYITEQILQIVIE